MGRRKGMFGRKATTFTKGNTFGFGACVVDVGCAITTYLNLPVVKSQIMPVTSLLTKGLTRKCMTR